MNKLFEQNVFNPKKVLRNLEHRQSWISFFEGRFQRDDFCNFGLLFMDVCKTHQYNFNVVKNNSVDFIFGDYLFSYNLQSILIIFATIIFAGFSLSLPLLTKKHFFRHSHYLCQFPLSLPLGGKTIIFAIIIFAGTHKFFKLFYNYLY